MQVLLPLLISVPKQERLHPPSHGVEEPLLEETDAVEAGVVLAIAPLCTPYITKAGQFLRAAGHHLDF